MRKVLVSLIVLLVILGAGEFLAARIAAGEIEDRVERETGARVDANVDSFPLVTRLLLTEEVDRLTVTLNDVGFETITFETVTIDARGLELPRKRLFDRKVKPTGIDNGTVTALVSSAALGDSLGAELPSLDPGSASAQLEEGALTIEVPGLAPLSVTVPQEVLPCSGSGKVVEGGVEMRCTVDEIPKILLENFPG